MARGLMSRRAARTGAGIHLPQGLLGLCLALGLLAGCSTGVLAPVQDPGPPAAGQGREARDLPPTLSAADQVTPSPLPSSSPTPSPQPSPSQTPLPTPTFTPSPMPTPTPPPLLPATGGAELSLLLQPLTSVDTHLMAGVAAAAGTEARYYFASLDRTIYAYGTDGQRRWRVRMGGPVYALTDLPGGEVAAGDDLGTVTMLSWSGARLWSQSLGTRVTALSGALPEGLLAGGWNEKLTLLSVVPEAKRVLWQVEVGSRVTGIAALPSLAVVSTADGRVLAFDPAGEALWSHDVGSLVFRLAAWQVQGGTDHEKGVVIAGAQDGRIILLERDGTLLWQKDLGEGCPVWSLARLGTEEGTALLAATGGGRPVLSLLSVAGEWIWRLPLPAPAGAVSTLDLDSDGFLEIVVGLSDGRILVYDQQGRLRASLQAGLSVWDVLPDGGGAGPGGLVLADLHAWRLTVGLGPSVKPRLRAPALLLGASDSLPSTAIPLRNGNAPREGAVLVFLGDVVPGRSMELQIDRYGAGYPWEGIGWLLRDADLVSANLECVLSTRGAPLSKLYVIRAHPETVDTLTSIGIGVVSLANNHTLDFGSEALEETLSVLERAGIGALGAGRTPERARSASMLELNGVRVAMLAYAGAYWRDSADMPDSDLVAWSDPESVADGVREVRSRADIVVVVLHAGKEYSRTPTAAQLAAARAAIDAGADLVVGHHPHVTQTVDHYRDGLVVYSLGNALFDIQLQSAMQGDLLRVLVTRDGLMQAELWPFWIDGEIQPRLLEDGRGVPVIEVIYP